MSTLPTRLVRVTVLALALLALPACSARSTGQPDGGAGLDAGTDGGADTASSEDRVSPVDGAADTASADGASDGATDAAADVVGDLLADVADGGDLTPTDAGGVRIEVGRGDLTYNEIAAGGEVPLTCGPQGGQHIWTSLRLYGFPREPDENGNPQVVIDLTLTVTRVVDDMVIGGVTTPYRASFVSETDPVELIGIANFLNLTTAELEGKMLRMTARATHASGLDVSATTPDFIGRTDQASCAGGPG